MEDAINLEFYEHNNKKLKIYYISMNYGSSNRLTKPSSKWVCWRQWAPSEKKSIALNMSI